MKQVEQGQWRDHCQDAESVILLSLENLRDLATVKEYKQLVVQQPYTILCFLGHDGHSVHVVCSSVRIGETTQTAQKKDKWS